MKDLHQKPGLVLYMDDHDQISLPMLGVHHEPWVRLVPGSRVISVTCSGDGLVRRGLLADLVGSLGHVKEACSMKNKEIRIVHNMLPPSFAVNDGAIDQTTFEGPVLKTFLERFSLRPSFEFAHRVWGVQNKSTGIWNGLVGLVGIILLKIFLNDPFLRLVMAQQTWG